MRSCKLLCNKLIQTHRKISVLHKIKNNIPNPILDHSSIIFYNFSQKNDNICENFFKISLDSKLNNCYRYLFNFKNLIEWNYFIYQIIENLDKRVSILHVYLNLKNYQIIELLLPITIVNYEKNKYIEFQNITKFGMPMCGRLYFTENNSNTDIHLYIKYPLPYYFEEMKISSEHFSLIIQELFEKCLTKLAGILEAKNLS
ncbi:hypothetical protein M951_chr386 (nucleomorph) [Lotharella oceanica]|uniref:Coenzyme Q-binding protein COQ10 START domain-containing protein n=1 Tax=Lotharella oceanica TaxID=641309 RepID=A0A060DBX0_9EUKA|nr:hypothetical protein M951_chr386 [Lotharella oceanica]|mmetsp:Transcript_2833/g.5379  ORF Transcript_2833/g.5379 Transcript_2833/m.5379 type:complete len:201 (+) Transcript_2833:1685-2287(+)